MASMCFLWQVLHMVAYLLIRFPHFGQGAILHHLRTEPADPRVLVPADFSLFSQISTDLFSTVLAGDYILSAGAEDGIPFVVHSFGVVVHVWFLLVCVTIHTWAL